MSDSPEGIGSIGSSSLLRVIPNSALVSAEQSERAKQAAEKEQHKPLLQGIAAHVMKAWESARDNKSDITTRLESAQLARLGKYDASKLAAIRAADGASEEYARVTSNKCRVAEAWLKDVYLGQTEKPWTLHGTPSPSMPPEEQERISQTVSEEIAQVFSVFGEPPPQSMIDSRKSELQDAISERMRDESRSAVERMERKMHDQLVEGGWEQEWAKFLHDLVTYPAAHFKGPIVRMRKRVQWMRTPDGWEPQSMDTPSVVFERVDPFRCYPSANSTDPQHGAFIEHVTLSRSDLYSLMETPGFKEDAIRGALQDYGAGGLTDWLGFAGVERQEQNLDSQDRDKGPLLDIDALEYHGPIRGRDLIDWGLPASDVPDIDADYEACVWLVGRWVIKAQLNYDPSGTRPYFKASWEDIPGSYWGMGLADALSDVQGVVNAAVRSLVNNMGIASGPQVAVNVDRLPPGEDISALVPWKIWQTNDGNGLGGSGGGSPISFFQPEANTTELLTVIEKFYQFADDWSLIPRYMSGNDRVGGAGRTASGLSMLLNAANKGLKGVVSTIDVAVLSPLLAKLYTFNMLYDEDETLKGDAQVMARGAVSLMQLETLQLRRNEFLAATTNEFDMAIIGTEGRAEVLREVAKGLEMDTNRVVPPRGAAQQPQQSIPTGPAQQVRPGAALPSAGGEQLLNGAAVTDNFSPNNI